MAGCSQEAVQEGEGCSATTALENKKIVTKAVLTQFWRLLGPKRLLNHAFHTQGIDPLYVWFCYDSVNRGWDLHGLAFPSQLTWKEKERGKRNKSLVGLASLCCLRTIPHVFMMDGPSHRAGKQRGWLSEQLCECQDTATSSHPPKHLLAQWSADTQRQAV